MTSSYLNVILLLLSDCGILQFTPSLRSEKTVLLLHKLLLKVLPVTTCYIVIAPFYFTYYVHMLYILVPLSSCNFHLYSTIVFVFARVFVLVVFLFCIS